MRIYLKYCYLESILEEKKRWIFMRKPIVNLQDIRRGLAEVPDD
jgi:hypothetical protein